METFWSQTLPNWVMAGAATWGVFEIIRGYFKLKKQGIESEQKMKYFADQLNEFRRQTTQFEYQTSLMSDSNKITEKGIENLTKILGRGQEAAEAQLEIERQKRALEIRPFLDPRSGQSNPSGFGIKMINQGGTASNFRLIDISGPISVIPFNANRVVNKGEEFEVLGRSTDESTGFNSNLAAGQILLGFTDVDGNKYQQNIIKNYSGHQVGLPVKIEE